ncbi:hypothetical protein [Pectobacterium zantedeschiae]|uniref:Uncharacterized protein n=1 Tax=Pectobacterium zantedeschiae TaxID=2034769 RepID=A0A9X8JK75_9GAMM|nr:hypothetical protein [Pectobacterium zantedeschiae]RYC44624.1 hypothetical protein CLR69_06300 [Pectobacterium zantedeschiae]RYC49781.1 hypothetical protein CTN06_02105 [Pectobacterium zantedeschiae]
MTWQGVPFPFGQYQTELLERGVLTVDKIPTIVVDSGFAWDTIIATLLGSLIAGWIPGFIALKSIRSNERNTRITIAITHHQKRIDEIKSTASEYMSNILVFGVYVSARNIDEIKEDNEYEEKMLEFLRKENLLRNKFLLIFENNSQESQKMVLKLDSLIRLNGRLIQERELSKSIFDDIKSATSDLLVLVKDYCYSEDSRFYSKV